jgi:hypothetical protein
VALGCSHLCSCGNALSRMLRSDNSATGEQR